MPCHLEAEEADEAFLRLLVEAVRPVRDGKQVGVQWTPAHTGHVKVLGQVSVQRTPAHTGHVKVLGQVSVQRTPVKVLSRTGQRTVDSKSPAHTGHV